MVEILKEVAPHFGPKPALIQMPCAAAGTWEERFWLLPVDGLPAASYPACR
jgi:hypothetical protein